MSIRLSRLGFRSGATPSGPVLEIEVPTVTLFVGPNNSGKSLALREIEEWCRGTDPAPTPRVLQHIDSDRPERAEDAIELLRVFKAEPPHDGRGTTPGAFWIARHWAATGVGPKHQELRPEVFIGNYGNDVYRRQNLEAMYCTRLDGRTRFALAQPQESGDLKEPPRNHWWGLFVDRDARLKVREATVNAFDLHFVIDPTPMTRFEARMSDRAPEDDREEQALDDQARAFHSAAAPLTSLGDGVQAFTGLLAAVASLPDQILLVDEPEAFLHPPLARRLGADLASVAVDRRASLVAATHSPDFLMGCMEATDDVVVIRLGFERSVPTARSLSADTLRMMFRDPLLRSADSLSALFHRAVVVTEADADRAFYGEINSRLLSERRGLRDCRFVNAQNAMTVARVIGPLRRLGVPAAGIVDFDCLLEPTMWDAVFNAFGAERDGDLAIREQFDMGSACLDRYNREDLKRRGVAAVSEEDRASVLCLLNELAALGLFVVPVGELECWLRDVVGDIPKKRWIEAAFLALGSDPSLPDYVRPGDDDVWGFLDSVDAWMSDPHRAGMPV